MVRIFWPVLCGLALVAPGALAQTDEVLTIRVEEGDTLRDLAAEHLGDPDLWTEILRANGLDAITDVDPGLELKIPAAQVAQANRALEDALDVIQQATEEGARLFAPDEIAEAIRLRDQGMAERQDGSWEEAISLAERSTDDALPRRSRWRSSSGMPRPRPCSATARDGSRASGRRTWCGPIGRSTTS